MNLYLVVSETLYGTVPILDDGTGPQEPYCIAELVIARSRGQAKYLVWRSDKDYHMNSGMTDMPKMSVRLWRKGLDEKPGIVSKRPEFQEAWEVDGE